MNTIMNNGWIQSIVGGLIVIGLTALSKWVFARNYLWRQAIFSIGVASIVFFFGNLLQPAVMFLIEGINPFWMVAIAIRQVAPVLQLLNLCVGSLLAGIPTGLAVLKGTSFKQRVLYGAISAPISLTIVDIWGFYSTLNSTLFTIEMRTAVANWHVVYFSLLCNLFGGMVGGFLVGAVSHLYFERLPARSSHRSPDFP
jgi:hypothetical protein